MESSKEKPLSFGAGIEFVLDMISIDDEDRQTFKEDAQQIENEFIRAISRRDPFFASAFRGLSLTGSNLDNVKINLPDEFDMLTTIQLPCKVEPVPLIGQPNYVLLRVKGDNIPYHLGNHQGQDYYISRRKIQAWFRDNVSEVIPEIKYIHCEGGRTYELKSISGGHVAHTIKDVCLSNPTQRSASTLCQLSNFWHQSGSMFFPKTRMRIAAGTPCPVKSELPMFRMILFLSSSVLLTGSEWS